MIWEVDEDCDRCAWPASRGLEPSAPHLLFVTTATAAAAAAAAQLHRQASRPAGVGSWIGRSLR